MLNSEIYRVKVKGIRPLLQNLMAEEEAGNVRKGQVYDDMEEATKRLVTDNEGNLCQPSSHFESAMIKSGVDFKFKGHKTYKELIKAGVVIQPDLIPHKITHWEIDKRTVKIGQARIRRCRPKFPEWELEFELHNTDDRVSGATLKDVLENAGHYYGVGDYRPKFGLFEVLEFEKIN